MGVRLGADTHRCTNRERGMVMTEAEALEVVVEAAKRLKDSGIIRPDVGPQNRAFLHSLGNALMIVGSDHMRRLVEAAPDLLAAAKDLVSSLEDADEDNYPDVIALRSAINKAEGGKS